MCGIISIVTKHTNGFSREQLDLFEEGLYATALRGWDSTGVALIGNDGSVEIAKAAVPSGNFIATKTFEKLSQQAWQHGQVLIGHCRKATMGKITDETAHPFNVNQELTLVHNGSLMTHKHLCDESDIDSQAIANYLHKNWDTEKANKENVKLIDDINGAWALIWHDKRSETLNIARNYERPLAIAENKDGWYIASELSMLKWLLDRNKIKVDTVEEIPVRKLLQWKLDDNLINKTVVDIPYSTKKTNWPATSWTGGYYGAVGGCSELAPFVGTDLPVPLSKNKFKKTANKLVGSLINFFADDFTEFGDEMSFYGQSDEIKVPHEVIGICTDEQVTYAVNKGGACIGKVKEVRYEKPSKKMIIIVSLVESNIEADSTIDNPVVQ